MPWETISTNSEILAIHAALLPTGTRGQVIYFSGDEHTPEELLAGRIDKTRILDLATGSITAILGVTTDLFCCGHAFLADGRLLVAGGTKSYEGGPVEEMHHIHFRGERATWISAPRLQQSRQVADMNFEPGHEAERTGGGRWYPTLVTLPDGRSLALSGHPTNDDRRQGHNNDSPEIYNASANTWTFVGGQQAYSEFYPRVFVLPTGYVFFATPVNGKNRIYDPVTGTFLGAEINPPTDGLYHGFGASAVLLPLLPEDSYTPRILFTGGIQPVRITFDSLAPSWQSAGARSGGASGRRRVHGYAVLLPTGDVVVCGGIHRVAPDDPTLDVNAVLEGEIYHPGIDWTSGMYTAAENWSTVESALVPRNYHSTALLLPDGRVWTAGSDRDGGRGLNRRQLQIDVYKPPYYANPNRPQLTDAPPSVGYNQAFEIRCNPANQIRRVAITRCGSCTHAFDSDQRYVGLTFQHGQGNRLRVMAPPNSRIAPPGYYLLWVLDQNNLPCQEAGFIRICSQRLQIILDRSTFSTHEVHALGPSTATPAIFANALYVLLDGFLPSEVGNPTVTPTLNFIRPDGSSVPGMRAILNRVLYEDDTVPPDIPQRIMFVFHIRFTNLQAFNQIPAADPAQDITVHARHGGNTEQAVITLSKNPNPYMRDGEVHWLSTDVRVFTMRPGLTRAGVTHGSGSNAPITFIQQLLNRFNNPNTPTGEDHPFFDIRDDPQESQLELASHVNGQPIFNFAVAKVRYRAPIGINAGDVRVFFRMFNVAATGLEFNGTIYSRQGNGANAAPLLGLAGNEIASIPFFAEARVADMRNQTDATNRRTIQGAGSGEVTVYFGCWLDFNQPTPRFPLNPLHNGSNGSFSGTLLSVQQLIRNTHCCLIAEIHYPLDPIPYGATPGSHDNLSQRNLVIVESDNPGTAATHTVQSTFEIKPSLVPVTIPPAFGYLPEAYNVGTMAMLPAAQARVEADELIIRWNNLPRDSHVTLYMPDVDIQEIVAVATARNGPHILTARNRDTIICRVGHVSYIPVTGPRSLNIPGLISIELPPTVTIGEVFTVTIHQVSGLPRKIIGSFQITIPVHTAVEILPKETRKLSVLRYIGQSIPDNNRWYKIWQRLLQQIDDRVRGLGGDPAKVHPSPTGEARPEDDVPSKPEEEKQDAVSGEISRLLYDCLGNFQGFVIKTCHGERTFKACPRGIEDVVLKACRDHLQVTVWFNQESEVKQLAINCC